MSDDGPTIQEQVAAICMITAVSEYTRLGYDPVWVARAVRRWLRENRPDLLKAKTDETNRTENDRRDY